MESRTKNATRNLAFGVINKTIVLLIPFVTRTLMIYKMGVQYVGLGSLFTSILSVLSFAELGVGSALVFSMYKPIAENDIDRVNALLAFYKKTYRIIGIVILLLGVAIMPFLRYLINGDVPSNINIYYLYSIYLINNILGYFLFAYKQSLFIASQRVDKISLINTITQTISGLFQTFILLFLQDYYLYVLVIPIITCLTNVLVAILSNKYFPQCKCSGEIDNSELKEIKKKIGGMVFQKIGNIVLSSVDTIVISAFLGLIVLGKYQNYYYIFTTLNGFLAIVMSSIIPVIGNSIVKESVEKNHKDFKTFNFLYIWIVVWWTSCLVCLYQPFMKIWAGESNMLSGTMALLFALYFFAYKWCDMLYVYQEASGIWWETRFVPILAAVLNLGINIFLVNFIGLPGILISTIISVVFVYDIGYSKAIYATYFKSINFGLMSYWKRQILYFSTAIISAVLCYTLCAIIPAKSSVFRLFVNLLICLFVPNIVMTAFWFKTPEFERAKRICSGIIKKFRRGKNVS